MAASGNLAVLVLAILVTGFAYYMWIPFPDDLDQKSMARSIGVATRLMPLICWLGSVFCGHKTSIDTMRVMGTFVTAPELDSDPLLQVNNDVFNGIPVRVFRPKNAPVPSPVMMYYHGGGFCMGTIEGEDTMARYLAKHSNVAVVSVDYRLAPEYPFPAAVHDCINATVHVLENGLQLGFDTSRVGVFGPSGGASLAMAVSFHLLDEKFQTRGLPKLKFQALSVPTLQALDFTLPSYIDNDEVSSFVLPRKTMAKFYVLYAGLSESTATIQQFMKGQHIRDKTKSELAKYVHRDLIKESQNEVVAHGDDGTVNETLASLVEPIVLNHQFSPLLAPTDLLKKLPPVFVAFSQYDILRDDGALYIRRLHQAGVEVTSYLIETGHHLTMFMLSLEPESETAITAFDKLIQFIKEHSKP